MCCNCVDRYGFGIYVLGEVIFAIQWNKEWKSTKSSGMDIRTSPAWARNPNCRHFTTSLPEVSQNLTSPWFYFTYVVNLVMGLGFVFCGNRFSLKTVLMLAEQLVSSCVLKSRNGCMHTVFFSLSLQYSYILFFFYAQDITRSGCITLACLRSWEC